MWDPRQLALTRAERFAHNPGLERTRPRRSGPSPNDDSTPPTPALHCDPSLLLELLSLAIDSQEPQTRLHRILAGVGLLPGVLRCELTAQPLESSELLEQRFRAHRSPESPDGDGSRWLRVTLDPRVDPRFRAQLRSSLTTCAQLHEQAQITQSLREQAQTDPLTGLWNRRAFAPMLEQFISRWDRQRESLTLLAIDVDHFKAINDGFGHDTGDKVLVTIARVLRQECRPSDVLVRQGGDELMVMLSDANSTQGRLVAERIQAALGDANVLTDRDITLSIGICDASFLGDQGSPDSGQALLDAADQALYAAKAGGRNRCVVHPGCVQPK